MYVFSFLNLMEYNYVTGLISKESDCLLWVINKRGILNIYLAHICGTYSKYVIFYA